MVGSYTLLNMVVFVTDVTLNFLHFDLHTTGMSHLIIPIRIIDISMGNFTAPIYSSDFHRKPFDWSYVTLWNTTKSQYC